MRESDKAVQVGGIHEDVPAGLSQGTEGEAGTIGRNSGRQGDGGLMSELALVGAVVIHDPDFFVAGAIADEKDFAFGDAGNAATQTKNDFVREFVGNEAGGIEIGRASCRAKVKIS